MMGFAVIPVIFTIAEDALSNDALAHRRVHAALGATLAGRPLRSPSRSPSGGIFSALMIGFGCAVGETMIVVMATGNTPIMDWDIFTGMRTLSANIAVELPEGSVLDPLPDALPRRGDPLRAHLHALNSVAEVLRQHLRENSNSFRQITHGTWIDRFFP
ncbi:MAG: hypothetical protein R3F11_21640 [Verrucomicrobiales bacterium]